MNQTADERRLAHKDHRYRAPVDLLLSSPDVKHVLIIGSCTSEYLAYYLHRVIPTAAFDHILYNFSGELPEAPPKPLGEYAFQVILLPLRTVMPETMFFGLSFGDVPAFEEAFQTARQRLLQLLSGALAYHTAHGITTFVGNFFVPQQNSMGRLLPKEDLRNPVFFVNQLNRELAEHVAQLQNAFLVDVDEVSATFGRRFIQDDLLNANSHGSIASDWDHAHDQRRLHPPDPLASYYHLRIEEFVLAVWHEIASMYRTLRQQDSIKIVILDLDDTLWRGVIAEEGTDNPALIEGWPLGITEALSVLKRRGILLSIVSKNDESTIRKLWDRAIGNRLPLTAFAAVKINWEPKARNVEAILKETNLLARNALFIDDNPTERDGVQSVYPEIRTLGADLYYIRRILLWAPELQVASITDEATRRTEMVQAQVAREQAREMMPRGEFLASLKVEVSRITIDSTEHPRFARALELINKTNQFNTTGERRTLEGLQLLFSKQAKLEAFEVYDRFTDYGLVAVVVINGQTIEQFVMSCRVVGLDVELAIMATLAGELCQSGTARGLTRDTDANFLSRKVFENSGFSNADNVWTATREKLISLPSHITFRA